MNILGIQLISNDVNNGKINCFQNRKRVFDLRTSLLFLSTFQPVALRTGLISFQIKYRSKIKLFCLVFI